MKRVILILLLICAIVGCVKAPEIKVPTNYGEMLNATYYTQTLHDKTYNVEVNLDDLNLREKKKEVILEENNCKVTLIMNRYLQDTMNSNAKYKYMFVLDFEPNIQDLTYSTYSTRSYIKEENTIEETFPLKVHLKSSQGEYSTELYCASVKTKDAPNMEYLLPIEEEIVDALKTEQNITATITIEGFYYQEGSNE